MAKSTNNDDAAVDDQEHLLECPGCDEAVEVDAQSIGQLVRCPYCNTDFFASRELKHQLVVDDTPAHLQPDYEAAFDQLRIGYHRALRMGAIRARSWWLIAGCLGGLVLMDMLGTIGIQLLVFRRWGIDPTLRTLVAALMVFLIRHALRRASILQAEINQSAIPEPSTPPDFSTLSNGTDRWKNLENVR